MLLIRPMALREFLDSEGRPWRVWDVAPDQFHAATNWEDYLQGYIDGWLVFEAVDGSERCRLYPIPTGWDTISDERLEELRRAANTDTTVERPGVGETLGMVRTFHYPKGRVWTAVETPVQYRDPEGNTVGSPVTVLRFTSGKRVMDLLAWPAGWHRYNDEEMAELLSRAFPRDHQQENPTPHRRRVVDETPEATSSEESRNPAS
jgi:hypothetical protein